MCSRHIRCIACGNKIDLMRGCFTKTSVGYLCGVCSVAYTIGLSEGKSKTDRSEKVSAADAVEWFKRISDELAVIRCTVREHK